MVNRNENEMLVDEEELDFTTDETELSTNLEQETPKEIEKTAAQPVGFEKTCIEDDGYSPDGIKKQVQFSNKDEVRLFDRDDDDEDDDDEDYELDTVKASSCSGWESDDEEEETVAAKLCKKPDPKTNKSKKSSIEKPKPTSVKNGSTESKSSEGESNSNKRKKEEKVASESESDSESDSDYSSESESESDRSPSPPPKKQKVEKEEKKCGKKRGISGYIIFSMEYMAEQKRNGRMSGCKGEMTKMAKEAGAAWGKLSDKEKEVYKQKAVVRNNKK